MKGWNATRAGTLGPWDYEIVFSAGGPPFFELIHCPRSSPWDATAGSRFDHIGYWSSDIAQDKDLLARRGAAIEFDSCPYGRSFTYHRIAGIGASVELVDSAVQRDFLAAWDPAGGAMSSLEP